MSDTAKRDAVMAEFKRPYFGLPDTYALIDEIVRLRDENAALTAERDRLAAAVERVRTLHVGEKRHVGWIDVTRCRECSDDDNTYAYPCPTLRALEETP